MSNIYACPACDRQYTVENPGNYLCDCGAVFYCPETASPDPTVVTQGIQRKDIVDKSSIGKLTADHLVKKRGTSSKIKAVKSSKNLEGTGSFNRRNADGTGSRLEATGSFNKKKHMPKPDCPFAKIAVFCGAAALCFTLLGFVGPIGLFFTPFFAVIAFVLAFISKTLLSDPHYERRGEGMIIVAICCIVLSLMVWAGILMSVLKSAKKGNEPPPPPQKVFIPAPKS